MKSHFQIRHLTSLVAVLCFALFAKAAGKSKAKEEDISGIAKMKCTIQGYQWKDKKRSRENLVKFQVKSEVANSEYDFSWSEDLSLRKEWQGPKGRFQLLGSTAHPKKNWATLTTDWNGTESKDRFEFKLMNEMSFNVVREVSDEPANGAKAGKWFIEAKCDVTL